MNKKNVPQNPQKKQLSEPPQPEVGRPSPEYQQKQVSAYQDSETQIFYAEHSASIIPTPEQMLAYQNVDPSFATTIMRWAEENLQHHRKMQQEAMQKKYRESLRNNIFAILGTCIVCGTGLLFAWWGHPKSGASIICATVIGIASVFVSKRIGKTSQEVK